MNGQNNRWRDLAGWLSAAGVTAALFAGAATAALRAGPGAAGVGPSETVPLDLSVGVVPLSAALPTLPPAVEMPAPVLTAPPQTQAAPDLPIARSESVSASRPDQPPPAMAMPQTDAPPVLAAPPQPPPDEPPLALAQSPRPVVRPDRSPPDRKTEQVHQAGPARPATPQPQASADRAQNAAEPAQAAGSDQAARPAQERRVAGGQAAARYGDQVMRQIARQRRQKAPDRGVVTVGFEIGADGGLRRVAVVSSSGSEALDLVALDHIRRAAPFPPPPEGAAVRFAFEFVGK